MTTTKELEEIRAQRRERIQALEGLPSTDLTEPVEYYQTPVKTYWQFAQVAPEHTLTKRLIERRISLEVISFFEIAPAPDGKGWLYPAAGGLRWKNVNSQAEPKYSWKPSKPESAELYHGADLMQSIQQARGACWLVSGEPDVWALRSAGIAHALSGFTESHVSTRLAEFLSSLGVTVLYIAPDLDDTGKRWSSKVARALEGSGIELDCRALPEDLGEHGDIGKAWQHYTKLMDFERWLIGLPRAYPEPERGSEPGPRAPSTDLAIPDDYRLAILERLGVSSFNAKGWSSKNVICPFHEDSNPSAGVHEYKGLHCLTEGTWYTWQKLGTRLGIGSISEWRAQAPASSRISLTNELRAALIKAGASATARVLDALYLLGWQPGKVFSRAEAVRALSASGIVKPWSVRLALEPGTTTDKETARTKTNYCGFFPSFLLQPVTMEKSHNNSKSKPKGKPGRKSKLYKLPAPGEIAAALGVEYKAHADTMAPALIANRADYRAEVYATLPRLKPGNYSRKTLSARVGISSRTAQSYDKRAALTVTERYNKQALTAEIIAELPEQLEPGDRRNRWLENGEVYKFGKRAGKARRFTPTLEGAERALESSPAGELWLVTQLTNHYSGGINSINESYASSQIEPLPESQKEQTLAITKDFNQQNLVETPKLEPLPAKEPSLREQNLQALRKYYSQKFTPITPALEAMLGDWLEYHFGDVPDDKLEPDDFENWLDPIGERLAFYRKHFGELSADVIALIWQNTIKAHGWIVDKALLLAKERDAKSPKAYIKKIIESELIDYEARAEQRRRERRAGEIAQAQAWLKVHLAQSKRKRSSNTLRRRARFYKQANHKQSL